MIKVVAPNMACQVIDWAMQVHGGGGVSGDFPLAYHYAAARTLRFADGPMANGIDVVTATPSPRSSSADTRNERVAPRRRSTEPASLMDAERCRRRSPRVDEGEPKPVLLRGEAR